MLTQGELGALSARFSALVVDRVVASPMVAGAGEFLDSHRESHRLFVVSGTPESELGLILERRGMRGYFDAWYGAPVSKADNVRTLLEVHGLAPDRCLMFGDALADLEGAAANGVPFLGRVAPGDRNIFPPGITVFDDFEARPPGWE